MESSLFALILTICIVTLVLCGWYCCKHLDYFLEKSYTINNVFNNDDDTIPDIDLIITEEKPNNVKLLDKVVGNLDNSNVDFYINKNNINSFELKIPSYSNYNFNGKGLVIAANGIRYRYITGVYMNIYVIRNLYGSDIPVEIVYVGEDEAFTTLMKNELLNLGNVKLIDLTERLNTNVNKNKLIGYRTKPLAVIASSFEEVVLMDADALSFVDPYYFFKLDGYINNGMVLYKDYVTCLHYIDKKFINNIGIGSKTYCKKTDGYELDSSCVVVNKQKAWEALYTICVINVESDSYYNNKINNVLGDKDTWLIGSMFVGFDPYVSEADPGLLLAYEEDGMEIVFGHLQSQKVENEDNIPLYYNNQAIDLSVYNGMDNWGYLEGDIKDPEMLKKWNKSYKKVTQQMKKTFYIASIGLKEILPLINIEKPKPNKNMIVKNLI
jgi:hypothetical protein